jgi:hypothetical protein
MKPIELLKFKEYNRKGQEHYNRKTHIWETITTDDYKLDLRGYMSELRKLEEYQDENCVVAYLKNCLGVVMLIRTKKDFFGFIITRKNFRGYTLFRTDISETYKMLNSAEESETDKLNIVEPELWKRFQAKVGLIELESN